MNHQDLTLEELEQTGWFITWEPMNPRKKVHNLIFALRRHGRAVYTIETSGATADEALTSATKQANAWLDDERRLEQARAALDL